ncbi:MAG TPA: hypothetical protein VNC15_04300 [Solirubrobacterales bacterium]|jgi:hypothetical protein|nr:hypothetical protein [Solirubrobacterales bacterium]
MSGRDAGDSAEWFFDRPFRPGEVEALADGVATWLGSEPMRWLVENLAPRSLQGSPAGLDEVLDRFGEICDWARPGTVWDYRESGERRLEEDSASASPELRDEVAARATALGLRSEGALQAKPSTFVVLGGRRLAPLNRARAAAAAMRRQPDVPARVVMLCGRRALDPAERESEEVGGYAPAARTESELMTAAAERAFAAAPPAEVRIFEVPDPPSGGRASTYETLRAFGGGPEADGGPLAIVTSPTCRPFQYLEAVRAIGLTTGRTFELIAHPPAWAAASPAGAAAPHAPHVYLQEIRSVIQAAGRLARALSPARTSA